MAGSPLRDAFVGAAAIAVLGIIEGVQTAGNSDTMSDYTLWRYRARPKTIIDGDTYDLEVDLGFSLVKTIRVRLNEVDTAETFGVDQSSEEYHMGKKHTQYARDWFEAAQQAHGGSWPVLVATEKTGKYGRFLADLEMRADPPEGYRRTLQQSFRDTFEELD